MTDAVSNEPDASKKPRECSLTDKERADVYAKLADLAWLRFNSRRDIEWKSAVGIWSAFGASTLGVFASSATFTWLAFVLTLIAVAAIIFVYGWFWLPYIAETMRRDQLVSYFWESGIQQVTGQNIREILEPWALNDDSLNKDLWLRMPTQRGTYSPEPVNDKIRAKMRKMHRSQKCQLALCILFGALLVLAVGIRAFSPHSAASTKLTVEGQFDAEKVKLTR